MASPRAVSVSTDGKPDDEEKAPPLVNWKSPFSSSRKPNVPGPSWRGCGCANADATPLGAPCLNTAADPGRPDQSDLCRYRGSSTTGGSVSYIRNSYINEKISL